MRVSTLIAKQAAGALLRASIARNAEPRLPCAPWDTTFSVDQADVAQRVDALSRRVIERLGVLDEQTLAVEP